MPTADCRLAARRAPYVAIPDELRFDFILIDGTRRMACARIAVQHRAQGGVIYLDDADASAHTPLGNVPAARTFLLDHARQASLPVREFVDFGPATLRVTRGLMIG